MKLLIFGATGSIGRLLVEQGHRVTAFVRDRAKLDIWHANLKIVQGDVLDLASVVNPQEALWQQFITCVSP